MKVPTVLVLGPDRGVISGVATHLNLLLGSALARRFNLVHFQVGSEGRKEGRVGMLARLIASPFRLAAVIARTGASIVHLNPSLDLKAYWRDLPHLLAAKLCGARVVYQIHGGAPSLLCGSNRLWSASMRRVLRATLRWPDVVVVLSRVVLEEMRALVPEQDVRLVPNAIDCAPFLGARRTTQGPLRLFHIGRLVKTKGAFETVQGLALARARGVDARLVIAGDGPDLPRLQQTVRDLGLAAQVKFAGPAFGERKARLVRNSDVLLLPTYHAEGLPYALLEGMAAGLVPIVTRIAAIPDVVTEGVHGLFVPPRDPEAIAQALARLDVDRAGVARMGAASREQVLRAYSIERLADDFATLYTSLRGASVTPRTAS
jgi:glycosyltransferase involved in cell wall biosynthesis